MVTASMLTLFIAIFLVVPAYPVDSGTIVKWREADPNKRIIIKETEEQGTSVVNINKEQEWYHDGVFGRSDTKSESDKKAEDMRNKKNTFWIIFGISLGIMLLFLFGCMFVKCRS